MYLLNSRNIFAYLFVLDERDNTIGYSEGWDANVSKAATHQRAGPFMEIAWLIWWCQLWCYFRDIMSYPSVPWYKTKKKGHQILFSQVPSFSILVGPLILLNAVRNGRFGWGWLSNPSWTFTAALNWAWVSCMVPQCIETEWLWKYWASFCVTPGTFAL